MSGYWQGLPLYRLIFQQSDSLLEGALVKLQSLIVRKMNLRSCAKLTSVMAPQRKITCITSSGKHHDLLNTQAEYPKHCGVYPER